METENKKPSYLKKNGGKRADMKHQRVRPALKTLASGTSNVKQQSTRPNTGSSEKPRVVQDECFTPRRSLCRSPPSSKKPDKTASVTPVSRVRARRDSAATSAPGLPFKLSSHPQKPSGKATAAATIPLNFEASLLDAVPPQSRCELPRTPACKEKSNTSSRGIQSNSRPLKQGGIQVCETSPLQCRRAVVQKAADHLEQVPPGKLHQGMDDKQKVVDCFTPSHALRRSPPAKHGQRKECSVTADLSSVAPPQTKFELPRTPCPRVEQPAIQESPMSLSQHELPQTPCPRVEQPAIQESPMSLSQHELPRTPCLRVEQPAIQESPMSLFQHKTSNDSQSVVTAERVPSKVVNPETVQFKAPNVEAHNNKARTTDSLTNVCSAAMPFLNPTAPCGLDCNENDMAFLQKIKNVRQYRHLETQVAHLDKGIRDAAAQKELLECEAQKVKQDLIDMRTKYYETVASIQALISNPVGTSEVAQPAAAGLPPITQAQIKKLRQVQQTVSVALEKTDRELKLKVTEVEMAKEKLYAQIRGEEQRFEERVKEKQCAHQCSEVEKMEWQKKLKELQSCRSEMEEKLSQSKVLLATQQHKDRESFLEEKRRAENRLRQIIKRCEMCVQRHKLLKEMKT